MQGLWDDWNNWFGARGDGKTQTVAGATCPGGPKEQIHGHEFLSKLMPAGGFNVLVKSQALSLCNTSMKYQVYLQVMVLNFKSCSLSNVNVTY